MNQQKEPQSVECPKCQHAPPTERGKGVLLAKGEYRHYECFVCGWRSDTDLKPSLANRPAMHLADAAGKLGEAKALAAHAVTDVERLEEQLQKAKEHLEQMNEQVGFYECIAQDALDRFILGHKKLGIIPSKRSDEEIAQLREPE